MLPDGRLNVQVGRGLVGGLIEPEELEKRAQAVVQRVEAELVERERALIEQQIEQQISLMRLLADQSLGNLLQLFVRRASAPRRALGWSNCPDQRKPRQV